jgi:primosomal protein N' (replication factor Y)
LHEPDALESLLGPLEPGRLAVRATVPVLMPVALDQTYDYLLPDGLAAPPGSFVLVPFGQQMRLGVVWDKADPSAKAVDPKKLKAIDQVLDVPGLPELSLRFVEWVARYTISPKGMVLRLMMGASAAFEAVPPKFGVRLVGEAPKRLTPGRQRVIDVARDGLIRSKSALAMEAGVSAAVVDGLVAQGTLVQVEIPIQRYPAPDPTFKVPDFNPSQAAAVHALRAAVDAGNFSVSLLDGITGSGKTEVYFEAVARALQAGRQVLVLLPEIALTSGFADRFKARFGIGAAEWHSSVSASERGRVWRAVATGEARAVIGARSALFLPFTDLGLVVVDEEHDTAFKQEDRVTYQGRDMAVVRGSLGNFPVVLASATPSIESHVNARTGRYRHLKLDVRYSGNALPDVAPIDMRADPPERGRWLSPRLVAEVVANAARGEQSLLFLNRRGYAPLTLCRTCGHRIQCPQCSAWLVEHRFRHELKCHHCGFGLPIPEKCPKCSEPGALVACGPGVERVAEEVRERFPDARLAILSSDLTPSVSELREILATIAKGEADIVIGTQIVAKGHNFPGLTLVGIVDGDLGLGQADPRASERTFQLLHQVTGRAGRAEKPGRGLVQTYMPEHPVMQAIISGDREAFLDREIAMRQQALMPPYGRLAALIVSGKSKPEVEGFARAVARASPPATRIEVLGPAEAPLAVIRGRHRFRLLVRAPKEVDLQAYLRAWLEVLPKIKGDLRLQVDVDPYSFL